MEHNQNVNAQQQPASDEIEVSLYDICAAIFRKKFMVAGILVVCVALAFVYLYFAVPTYEASATVMVSSLSGDSESLSSLLSGFTGSSSTDIATEVALLNSRRTIEDALSSLDLTQYIDSDGVRYSDFEFPLTATGLLAGDVVTVATQTDTNIVEITVSDSNPQFAADLANAIAESYNKVLTGFAMTSADASTEFVNSQIPVVREQANEASRRLADFQKENSVMQSTLEGQVSLASYNYLVSRRGPLELEAGEAEAMLFSMEGAPSYEEAMADSAISALVTEIAATLREILSYDLMTVSVSAGSSGAGGAVSGSGALTAGQQERYFTLTIRQQTLERNLSTALQSFAVPNGLGDADARSYASAAAQYIAASAEIGLIDELAAVENEKLAGLPDLEMELAQLQSEVEVYQTMMVSLMQMEQEAQLRAAAISDNVVIIDDALVPQRPVSPNALMVIAVAAFLGLFIGVGLALLMELSDKAVFTSDDLKKTLPPDVPFLGWIPMLKARKKERYPVAIVHTSPNSFESEKYKLVASNIVFGRRSTERLITVCSTDKNEGKTSVMANVAIALTQNGYRVCLVDCDLRMPSLERYFDLESQARGLVDIVMEGERLDNCIVQPLADVPSLHLLPSGASAAIPSMVYTSQNFADVVDQLKRRYDIVLFDAPPLEYASELLALIKSAPEVVIVVRAGISNKNVLADMIGTLRNAGGDIIGACLNAVIASHGQGKGYGYYYTSNKDPKAMAGVMKRIPVYSSRKMYYRKRFKRDEKFRGRRNSGKKIRPTHPFAPDLDLAD